MNNLMSNVRKAVPQQTHSAARIADALQQPQPTAEQVAVIEAPLRPLLVVAGAGSGKTETMASRVVWLVANGMVEPDQVLGLTFTRKAAAELAERIGRRLRRLRQVGLWTPPVEEDGAEVLGGTPTVSTYHSYAGRLVREHALRLGIEPEARLLSEAAAWQYASEVTESYDGPLEQVHTSSGSVPALSTVVNAVTSLAGEMAEHLLTVDDVERFLAAVAERVPALPPGNSKSAMPAPVRDVLRALDGRRQILPLVQAFLDLKRRRDALDFSDQMALAARLADRFPDIGRAERERFGAVLLDEFQDTSEAQLVLLRGLFVPRRAADAPGDAHPDGENPGATTIGGGLGAHTADVVPVTAVGDPHQSIYGWRGASATTLARFPTEFQDRDGRADTLPLSTSWRNDIAVLAAANLSSRPLRDASTVDVQMLRARPDAGPGAVAAARLTTTEDEAAHVAAWVAERWFVDGQLGRRSRCTAAVLCRKRSQFAVIVSALEARGLPVEVVGLGGLLSTPEVSDLVALLRVVQDPSRGDHLMRLLTGPLCRLGAADLDGLAVWSRHLQRRDRGEAVAAGVAGVAGPAGERAAKDQSPDSKERGSIVEALEELPSPRWRGSEGQRIGDTALQRLGGLSMIIRRLRGLTGLGLADLAGEAERALGLDIEVLARPEHTLATARAHLDAFADVAATFSSSADRPTLGGFLSWLDAALEEERGLEKSPIEASLDAVQVLTIHAAKGLEWDHVAVAGLCEGVFPSWPSPPTSRFSGGQWRVGEPKDKGWCSGLDAVPYDLRGDFEGLPQWRWRSAADLQELKIDLDDYAVAGGRHALAEERRLAYVALTRARRDLLLTAHIWGEAKSPRVTSRFLAELLPESLTDPSAVSGAAGQSAGGGCRTGAVPVTVDVWAPMPEPDADGKAENPRLRQARTQVWPVDPGERRRAQLADGAQAVIDAMAALAVDASEPALPISGREQELAILLAERRQAGRRRELEVLVPRHLSASAVVALAADPEAFARSLRRPMPTPPATAARRGTAFHAWVEQHYARAALVDLMDLPGSADELPGADTDLSTMKARFLDSEWAGRLPESVETAIETVIDGMAIRGRIDAVFARPGGGFTVVDWKTGAQPTGAQAKVRAIQLGAYRVAFARLRGLPLDAVDAAFYYAASGTTVWPDLPDDQELGALLRSIPS